MIYKYHRLKYKPEIDFEKVLNETENRNNDIGEFLFKQSLMSVSGYSKVKNSVVMSMQKGNSNLGNSNKEYYSKIQEQ